MKYLILITSMIIFSFYANCEDILCLNCHKDKKADFTESVHFKAGINCTACHGGNSKKDKLEDAHGTDDFIGKPSRKEIPQLCANCHSDEKKMRQYGLPTDQFDKYKTSTHGKKLYKDNDTKVAVCIDCHTSHRILKKKDPSSSVFVKNIPATCGKCHSDEKLMSSYK